MERKALYSGSFDPITNGHLNIISRAVRLYDELVIAVVANPNKKTLFTLEERMDIIKHLTAAYNNIKVECFDGLLADYVDGNAFDVVIRGLRNSSDFDYELVMAQTNACLYTGDTENVYLMTDPEFSFISSSTVKEIASLGGDISGFVPDYVAEALYNKYGRNK